ncbi:hypothetical protein [Candidatus Pristimantibacillus sp. PTI5]|uniref:hypothetical protein n=1 Tax=Candidatus Pristimantibacillus sp. PTI5 TaxID=3400422 RepID=UPI003B01251A
MAAYMEEASSLAEDQAAFTAGIQEAFMVALMGDTVNIVNKYMIIKQVISISGVDKVQPKALKPTLRDKLLFCTLV